MHIFVCFLLSFFFSLLVFLPSIFTVVQAKQNHISKYSLVTHQKSACDPRLGKHWATLMVSAKPCIELIYIDYVLMRRGLYKTHF